MLLEMDEKNAIAASRLAKPFTEWRLYDAPRRAMIEAELARILDAKPSPASVRDLHQESRVKHTRGARRRDERMEGWRGVNERGLRESRAPPRVKMQTHV